MKHQFVVLDFEFREPGPGEIEVVCMVAVELGSGHVHRLWLEGDKPSGPPFPCGPNTILVAHAVAPAEARCWRVLGWPSPGGWIDTYVEERVLARGGKPSDGFSLLACCLRNGVRCISSDVKESMVDLILKGAPHSSVEKELILDYCESDVVETAKLFLKQLEK